MVGAVEALKLENRDFALWLKSNTAPHRMAGYRIVTASLKPAGAPPGDAFARLADLSAGLADRHPGATSISAGMSADLEAAVANGSTHVRVGSALLGRRPPLVS